MHAAGGGVPRRRRAGVGADAPVRRSVGVRGSRRRSRRGRQPAGGDRRRRCRAARPRRRRTPPRLLQRLPAPRPRAGAVRGDGPRPLDPLPVPRLALRTRRLTVVDAAVRRPGRLRQVRARAGPRRRRGVARLGDGQRIRRRAAAVGVPRRPRRAGRRLRAGAAGRRRDARLRAGHELEAHRRELPRVLPLPEHPSAAVQRQPADERRERRRPGGVLGRRLAGSHAPRRDDVAVGRVSDGPAARPARRRPAHASTTSGCCPTCSSACIPTT